MGDGMGYMTADEACLVYGISPETLKKRRQRGTIDAVKQDGRWVYPVGDGDYQGWLDKWVYACRTGAFNNRPMSERTIEIYLYGLDKFWKHIKKAPAIAHLTPENLETAICSLPIDPKKQTCHYAQKKQMYDGVTGLVRYLVKKKNQSKETLDAMREHRPRRAYPAKRKMVQATKLKALITAAQANVSGKTDFDIALTMTIIYLMAYAGLRKSEVITLCVADVNLKAQELHVVCGKGLKNRWIGIQSTLQMQLKRWLAVRQKVQTKSLRLLIQADGTEITKSVIKCRFDRLAKRSKVPFSAHALRRAFATIHADKGVPLSHLQEQLGHGQIETTMGYIMTDERVAMESLKRL